MRGPGDWSREGGLLSSRQKAVGRIWVGPPPEWRRGGKYRWLCVCPAPMQYESPGAETLLSPSEDADAHTLLRLRQRFSGLARCLGLMLRCVRE